MALIRECYFNKAETFLNTTNTKCAVYKKWNILVSFLSRVLDSLFFFKVVKVTDFNQYFFQEHVST